MFVSTLDRQIADTMLTSPSTPKPRLIHTLKRSRRPALVHDDMQTLRDTVAGSDFAGLEDNYGITIDSDEESGECRKKSRRDGDLGRVLSSEEEGEPGPVRGKTRAKTTRGRPIHRKRWRPTGHSVINGDNRQASLNYFLPGDESVYKFGSGMAPPSVFDLPGHSVPRTLHSGGWKKGSRHEGSMVEEADDSKSDPLSIDAPFKNLALADVRHQGRQV